MRANRGNKKPHSIRRLVGYVKKKSFWCSDTGCVLYSSLFFFCVITVSKQINGNYSEPCQFFFRFFIMVVKRLYTLIKRIFRHLEIVISGEKISLRHQVLVRASFRGVWLLILPVRSELPHSATSLMPARRNLPTQVLLCANSGRRNCE